MNKIKLNKNLKVMLLALFTLNITCFSPILASDKAPSAAATAISALSPLGELNKRFMSLVIKLSLGKYLEGAYWKQLFTSNLEMLRNYFGEGKTLEIAKKVAEGTGPAVIATVPVAKEVGSKLAEEFRLQQLLKNFSNGALSAGDYVYNHPKTSTTVLLIAYIIAKYILPKLIDKALDTGIDLAINTPLRLLEWVAGLPGKLLENLFGSGQYPDITTDAPVPAEEPNKNSELGNAALIRFSKDGTFLGATTMQA